MKGPHDFEEHTLFDVLIDEDGDSNESIAVWMTLACTRNSPHFRKQATVRFVGDGMEMTLAALPFASLRKIADFIHDVLDDYESK